MTNLPTTNIRPRIAALRASKDPNDRNLAKALELVQEVLDAIAKIGNANFASLQAQIDACCNATPPSTEETITAILCYDPIDLAPGDNPIPLPAEADGFLCFYVLKQGDSGGGTVTWDPAFGDPGQPVTDANTYSVFVFFKYAGKMRVIGAAIKGLALGDGTDTPTVPSPGLAVYSASLVGDTSISVPTDPDGTFILYIFDQAAGGNWGLTWDSAFGTNPQPASQNRNSFLWHKESATELRLMQMPAKGAPIVGAPITAPAPVLVKRFALTSDKPITVPPESPGTLYVYMIEQDLAGNRAVMWPTAFGTPSPGQTGLIGSTYSAFWFHKETDAALSTVNLAVKNIPLPG